MTLLGRHPLDNLVESWLRRCLLIIDLLPMRVVSPEPASDLYTWRDIFALRRTYIFDRLNE